MNLTRREMLRELLLVGISVTAASAVLAGCGSNAATTSDANTATAASSSSGTASSSGPIRLGFIPLTDCASLVVADQMGLFKKHRVQVEVVKMANWNAVRDVAAEMLSGASGIGFSAFDAYNQGRLDDMMATIIVIGAVGLILDKGFDWIQRRLSYEDAPGK